MVSILDAVTSIRLVIHSRCGSVSCDAALNESGFLCVFVADNPFPCGGVCCSYVYVIIPCFICATMYSLFRRG